MFNKHYLDYELEDVLQSLHVQPTLQPAVEGQLVVVACFTMLTCYCIFTENMNVTPPIRPSQLAASYLRTARLHHEQVNQLLMSLRYQHEAIRIATTSLDFHVLAIFDTFDSIAVNAKRELAKQTALLEGLDSDLEMIKMVQIHTDFMSTAVRRATEAGERHRTLGDYVSNDKMRTVAAGCARTHGVCTCVNPQCLVDTGAFRGLGIAFRTHGKGRSQIERRHRYHALLSRR